jgi:hypothetical protein
MADDNSRVGVDVSPAGTVYFALVDSNSYGLYTLGQIGHVDGVGPIGNGTGTTQRDIAVAPTVNRFAFSAASYDVTEGTPFATVTVNRTGPLRGTASVGVQLTDGSTTLDSDYLAAGTPFVFGDGVSSATARIPILNDVAVEGDETLNLQLVDASGADAGLDSPASATLTVHSDDVLPDTRAPKVAVNAPESRTLKQLLEGISPSATPDEPAKLEFSLLATARSATAAAADNIVLARRTLKLAAGKRSAKLKPARKLLRGQKRAFTVRVQVIATDAAGNRARAVKRTVSVKVPKKKRR